MQWLSRRRLFAVASAVALGLSGAASALAQARSETKINLMSAPFGTGSYVLANALEQISNKHHPWLRITAAESPGFVFNLKQLDAEPELAKTTIFGSGPAIMRLAADGARPFDKKLNPLKVLGNYTIVVVWLAATDMNIKGAADMSGKRVALGQAAQINWAVLPRAVIEHGWGVRQQVKIEYLGPKPAVQALLDGKVDLAIVGGYINPETDDLALSPQTIELVATGRQLNHLSWGPGSAEKAVPKGFQITPYTIPKGKIKGKDAPLETFTDAAAWMVSPDFPEELAYETTKLLLSHLSEFGEVHAVGKLMSKAGLIHGWKTEDFHPGALRAYKEAGLIK